VSRHFMPNLWKADRFAIDIFSPDGRITPNMNLSFAKPRSRRPRRLLTREGRELCFG
jgi:hypothetical protein